MPVLHMCRYAPGVHVISVSSQLAFEIKHKRKVSTPFLIGLPFFAKYWPSSNQLFCLLWNVAVPSGRRN